MKLSGILEESLSHVVFHATTLKGARGILRDKIVLGSQAPDGYYISFSRNRTGDYPKFLGADMKGSKDPIVVFEFDGKSVGANHKGRPIDSFHDQTGTEYDDSYGYKPKVGINYQEDRLFLGKNEDRLKIKDSDIRRIDVIINGMTKDNVQKASKFKGNPKVRFYATIRDFMQRNAIEAPVVDVTYGEVHDAIVSYIYTNNKEKRAEFKDTILAYARRDIKHAQDVARLFFSETGDRHTTIQGYLDDI